MQADSVRIRVNYSAREIEIAGSEQIVRDLWSELEPLREHFASDGERQPQPPDDRRSTRLGAARQTNEGQAGTVPEEFGEFFQGFRHDITDVDRVLVAASFVQSASDDNGFTTGEANQLLQNQGVKLSNASESVRRNVAARRAFPLMGSKGKYRVSLTGREHLQTLKVSGGGE